MMQDESLTNRVENRFRISRLRELEPLGRLGDGKQRRLRFGDTPLLQPTSERLLIEGAVTRGIEQRLPKALRRRPVERKLGDLVDAAHHQVGMARQGEQHEGLARIFAMPAAPAP